MEFRIGEKKKIWERQREKKMETNFSRVRFLLSIGREESRKEGEKHVKIYSILIILVRSLSSDTAISP